MSIQAILYHKGESVVTVGPHASLQSAAQTLRDQNIAALVVELQGEILGLISEREIVRAIASHGEHAAALTVEDAMARKVVTIAPGDSLKRAMSLMTRHRTRHLLVLRGNALAGIVSIGDVIKHRLEDLELTHNFKSDAYAAAH
jgi:CBS domain-containing protein